MTVCNMTIEGGGRAGMVAPDDTTFAWFDAHPPRPGAPDDLDAAVDGWRELHTDEGAEFDREVVVDAGGLSPMVTWGTTPGMVVPGSHQVKVAAEEEGLDRVFLDAGFEWREAGCSMCLGMNPDILQPGERCASTSNRNFEGRQGRGGRTHLVSPQMAAAAAIEGRFVDIRRWQ